MSDETVRARSREMKRRGYRSASSVVIVYACPDCLREVISFCFHCMVARRGGIGLRGYEE